MPKRLKGRKLLNRKLDTAFSILIRKKGRCERCGRMDSLQDAHVVPKTNKALRWDIFNHLCLCIRCHLWFAHKDPLAFTDWFCSAYPNRAKYLEENRTKLKKRTEDDLKELLRNIENEDLHKLITFLQGGG
jgi:hypothetical protein